MAYSEGMQRLDGAMVFSATDLNNFLECRRLAELEELVARRVLQRPEREDERSELVRRKGDEHEARYLRALEDAGVAVARIARAPRSLAGFHEAEAQTRAAMQSGAQVIYQATFFDGAFLGHADFLRRVERPSDLGHWSYEVIDTKLALETKPYFLLQLCNYSAHLERLQGVAPLHGYVVSGNGEERAFAIAQYAAYYRHVKHAFLHCVAEAAKRDEARTYPLRRSHCTYCAWDDACRAKRRADDHLSLVAWMRRDQIARFEAAGITTVARLAEASDDARPQGMNPETFVRLRRQAALQCAARDGTARYEVLPLHPGAGFALLPPPDDGDVFFDMEGDPLYEPGRSLEYLFGIWCPREDPPFRAFWGLDRAHEKLAFEAFVDDIVARRKRSPAMHVYHYANYEKAALRRLAQQHATREDAVDDLLRAEVFVDLYAVARQALAISEESYSIKRFEQFYGLERATHTKRGDDSIVMFEQWLLSHDDEVLHDIERYNADDCRSTYLLREWLLERREERARERGELIPFRDRKEVPATPEAETNALPSVDDPLLEALLAYHRREAKPVWWAFFDRCENADDLLEFDREAIGGLRLLRDVAPRPEKRSMVYSYHLPPQRYKLGVGDKVCDPATHQPKSIGVIHAIDDERGVLELKSTMPHERALALNALVPGGPVNTEVQQEALARIARAAAEGTLESQYRAVADMLERRPSRMRGGTPGATLQPEHVSAEAVSALVAAIDSSYLFIQGPPGTGKTTVAAAAIADLLQAGKRVGIVSTGHKAIHHLLHKVEAVMRERRAHFRGRYKHSDNAHSIYISREREPAVESCGSNADFATLDFDLAAGTAWLFTRPELCGAFDYLFIDEAGQVALADALAVSACAQNVVLLGDPAQLAQVSQGTHPHGADCSVLEHLLGDHATIPPDRGIFLDRSYRMHPDICAFISDVLYDGRLSAAPATRNHRVESPGLRGSGLRYVPIEHEGNAAESLEEAEYIATQIALLRAGTVSDDDGIARPLLESDIIVVTPYNAQRRRIERTLRAAGFEIAVGTVDRFQGQEAAVVFYSMATSSGDDIPRDLNFIFEQNRLNVAVSRARALSIVVGSPRLLDVSCTTIEQMTMLNVLCAYVERAQRST